MQLPQASHNYDEHYGDRKEWKKKKEQEGPAKENS